MLCQVVGLCVVIDINQGPFVGIMEVDARGDLRGEGGGWHVDDGDTDSFEDNEGPAPKPRLIPRSASPLPATILIRFGLQQ